MPDFASSFDRQLTQALMQPALIRVIDNIRKQLDQSDWAGSYQDEVVWPPQATTEQQQRYADLQQLLEAAAPEDRDALQQALDQLPQPEHLYTLCLKKGDLEHRVDVWALCYAVCRSEAANGEPITADRTLIDEQINDVDWIRLDQKAQQQVTQAFGQLPG
ncbi:MAG: hypothetical protein AAFQ61_09980 [Cyanobacteria bacterium J06626_23]